MQSKTKHPEWATKHKRPNTELRLINERYYLYGVSSKWNPQKKRAQKITGPLLGRITKEQGFEPSSKKKLLEHNYNNISIKEYGVTFLVEHLFQGFLEPLKRHFPDTWQALTVAALFRLVYQAPLKNMDFYFSQSFLSEMYTTSLSSKHMTYLLQMTGQQRNKIIEYCAELTQPGEHVLVDVTAIHSKSEELPLAKKGYNSQRNFDPQVNLLLIFSNILMTPVYYRVVPGNIRDVKAFKLSLLESGVSDAIVIADKGFYSQDNVQQLDEASLKYILPVRRNSALINYDNFDKPHKIGMDGFFKYRTRYIWFYRYKHGDKWLTVFLDGDLKNNEEKDYLDRIQTHPEEYSLKEFQERNKLFGTFAILTNLTDKSAEEIYNIYKCRMNIECALDTFKNLLHADKSYMRNERSFEGWMFINFLALTWYYSIYRLLVKHELLSKYSPKDLLMHLSEIKKVKIQGKWHLAELPSSTATLLKKVSLPIT